MLRNIFIVAALALAACVERKPELPPLPPAADLCTFYSPWQMSAPAAAVETIGNLRTHAANNTAHYDKCVANHPALDPKRAGGPR